MNAPPKSPAAKKDAADTAPRTRRARPAPERPVVYRYLDALRFLADSFEHAKTVTPALSHRYVAKAMNASSSGFFKDILNGRIRISAERAVRFAKLFKLLPTEAAYFETLVQYTQADSPAEKDRLLARLGGGGSQNVLEAFQLEYFRKWHYAAVREALAVRGIRDAEDDAGRLAALFVPSLTVAQVRDALRLLLKLRMIRKNAQGFLERSDAVVRSGKLDDPARIKPAIRGNIELALRALDTLPAAIRPFSYLTVSVSDASMGLIRDKITELRREILAIAARDAQVDRLYQVNFQMFPLTRVAEDSSDQQAPRAPRKSVVPTGPAGAAKTTKAKNSRPAKAAKTAPGGHS